MVPPKRSALFILFVLFTKTQIILLEEETPETHGGITINSTKNRVERISNTIDMSSVYPEEGTSSEDSFSYYPKIHHKTYRKKIRYPSAYKIKRETAIKIEPLSRKTTIKYTLQDQRIKDLLAEIQKTSQQLETFENATLRIKDRKNKLSKLSAHRSRTRASIKTTQKEIASIEISLKILRSKLSDLSKASVEESQKIKEMEQEIATLQFKLQQNSSLLHKLHKLRKKYLWLKSEYNYYEESSDTDYQKK